MTETNTEINNAPSFILHDVLSVQATQDEGAYLIECDITGYDGNRAPCLHGLVPGDDIGYSPAIRQWLADHSGEYQVIPYAEPTAEEIRNELRPITPRQLRLALSRNGTSLAAVTAALEASGDEEAQIEWEYATTFERNAPALLSIASALGMTPDAVDTLWAQALLI
jgi:hypothetical protein